MVRVAVAADNRLRRSSAKLALENAAMKGLKANNRVVGGKARGGQVPNSSVSPSAALSCCCVGCTWSGYYRDPAVLKRQGRHADRGRG